MDLKHILFVAACFVILCLTLFTFYLVVFNPKLLSKAIKESERDRPHMKARSQSILSLFYVLENLRADKKTGVIFWIGLTGVIGTVILMATIIGFYAKMKLAGEL